MRLALIALVLFAGLTAGNVVIYQREMAGIQNPYTAPTTPVGAAIGSAVAQDASRAALRNAWLREGGAAVLVGVLWLTIARAGRRPRV
jgi:hypothetical protein